QLTRQGRRSEARPARWFCGDLHARSSGNVSLESFRHFPYLQLCWRARLGRFRLEQVRVTLDRLASNTNDQTTLIRSKTRHLLYCLGVGTGTIGLLDNVHHLPCVFTMTLVTIPFSVISAPLGGCAPGTS